MSTRPFTQDTLTGLIRLGELVEFSTRRRLVAGALDRLRDAVETARAPSSLLRRSIDAAANFADDPTLASTLGTLQEERTRFSQVAPRLAVESLAVDELNYFEVRLAEVAERIGRSGAAIAALTPDQWLRMTDTLSTGDVSRLFLALFYLEQNGLGSPPEPERLAPYPSYERAAWEHRVRSRMIRRQGDVAHEDSRLIRWNEFPSSAMWIYEILAERDDSAEALASATDWASLNLRRVFPAFSMAALEERYSDVPDFDIHLAINGLYPEAESREIYKTLLRAGGHFDATKILATARRDGVYEVPTSATGVNAWLTTPYWNPLPRPLDVASRRNAPVLPDPSHHEDLFRALIVLERTSRPWGMPSLALQVFGWMRRLLPREELWELRSWAMVNRRLNPYSDFGELGIALLDDRPASVPGPCEEMEKDAARKIDEVREQVSTLEQRVSAAAEKSLQRIQTARNAAVAKSKAEADAMAERKLAEARRIEAEVSERFARARVEDDRARIREALDGVPDADVLQLLAKARVRLRDMPADRLTRAVVVATETAVLEELHARSGRSSGPWPEIRAMIGDELARRSALPVN